MGYVDWAFLATWLGAPSLVVIVIVALAVFAGNRTSRAARRATAVVAAAAGAASLLLAAYSATAIVSVGIQAFTSPTRFFTDVALSSTEAPDFVRDTPAIVDGGYSTLWLQVKGVDAATRWALWLQDALPWVAALAVAITIVWLALRVLRRRPFGRRLPIAIGISAIAVLIGGIGTQVFDAIVQSRLIDFLGPDGTTSGCTSEGLCESIGSALSLDSSPVFWALGLALVAAAFQYGATLQRDTEGLV
ncbi:hypothetical protein PU630_01305 [Microbacterium horticulturae]|uniref:Uncharacterized protein n=1 Tax=Microbacterium horticulturae TaxID=3028316 RepID=A0ABY8C0H0_9MICO|nr:hypothetical protein [Microbacterium sp. KACC 23027]WEG09227.1 hypothetical protein PU630_01305 [Microbacterium sp. KACC 23027]